MANKGYSGLLGLNQGARISMQNNGSKRCGIVVVPPTKENGWFKIRWDGDNAVSSAHAKWFFAENELQKMGIAT